MLADGAVHGRRIEALALELGVFVARGLDGDAMPALALAEPRSARVERSGRARPFGERTPQRSRRNARAQGLRSGLPGRDQLFS